MYTQTINISDFTNGQVTATIPGCVSIQVYSYSGSSLIDNNMALITSDQSGTYVTLFKENYEDSLFPLVIVGVDEGDSITSADLFGMTRTTVPDSNDRIAIGKRGKTCVNVEYPEISRYMTESLGFLSSNPIEWSINPKIAQQKLGIVSREYVIDIDSSAIHCDRNRHYNSKSGIQPVGSYSGTVTLYGMRVNNLVQHYKVALSAFSWRGLGRGEFYKITSLGPGSDIPDIYCPIDVPVFMFGNTDKTVNIASNSGWYPPMFIVTPMNRTMKFGLNYLDPGCLYLVILDWTTASGIPQMDLVFTNYYGKTYAIGDMQ